MPEPRVKLFVGQKKAMFIGYAGRCDVWVAKLEGGPPLVWFVRIDRAAGRIWCPDRGLTAYAYPLRDRWRRKNRAPKAAWPNEADFAHGKLLVDMFHGGFFDA